MTPYDQAQAWLRKQSPAVAGAGGHNQAYHVITALAQGFSLGAADVASLAAEFNRSCQPPWSERELEHKVRDAIAAKLPPGKSNGYMLRNGAGRTASASRYVEPAKPRNVQPRAKCEPLQGIKLPDPMPDGARALLRAAFREGEGVRIANASLNEDGREIPAGEGSCFTREEWLRKLDGVNGNPNGIFSSSKRTGIYITINPLRVGGSKDADVTAFRHALVEFDDISREEQWALYQQSKLPCAAIISSGGKSIHAWVKIDAQSRTEYDERVRIIYEHFAGTGKQVDGKNKNPSRFSRLPNCVRFGSRQELLALDIGHGSFTEWLKEQQNADLGECKVIGELLELDTRADANCLIGFAEDKSTLRYLCKGKAAWLIGPSGIGKSSLLAQFAIGWARGVPVFGIRPVRPLRSLIVQAENDDADLAEMVQGIAVAHGIGKDAFDYDEINARIRFKTETTCVGPLFCDRLHRLIDREKPDLVWADPLLSFAGIDVSSQESASRFLRQELQPVLEATGVGLIGIHHTGKPKYAKDIANWTPLDYAYSGIGSSELVNWARAVMVLHPHGEGAYELKLAKRGPRAGATHPDGSRAYLGVWIQHAHKGILWHQIDPPSEPEQREKAPKEKRLPESEALMQFLTSGPAPTPWDKLRSELPAGGEKETPLGDRIAKRAKALGKSISGRTCRNKVIPLLVAGKHLSFSELSETYK